MIPVTAQSFDAFPAAYWPSVSPKHCCTELDLIRHNDDKSNSLSSDKHWRLRRLRQFWCGIQKTKQHVVSTKERCGERNLVSLRLHPLLGKSVSPPWITHVGFAAHWSSALDNLGDRLTRFKGIKCYIGSGSITYSYPMAISGWHERPHQHLVHFCGIQYP